MSSTARLVNAQAPPIGSVGESRQGVVSVHLLGLVDKTARCSCGWAGRRRILRAAAEQDAWAHSMQDGCMVSSPLVFAR
ncbi:hypothetical protein [Mycolicibacterium hodleri]|uniref:hypothetical protein n=1 Tax=Mycolicibacterium hodleri TaxID=49897 RepID=UPI00112B10A6|nr:hypothetical protein [Mycolicibacterium hodleri]